VPIPGSAKSLAGVVVVPGIVGTPFPLISSEVVGEGAPVVARKHSLASRVNTSEIEGQPSSTFFVNNRVVKILPCCTALHEGLCRASRHSRNGGQRDTV